MGIIAKILCGILALNLYGMSAYVSEVDHAENMVCFTDYATEHDWWIEGDSDKYAMWDDVVLVMHDCGTESCYDDIVVTVTLENFYAESYVTKGAE